VNVKDILETANPKIAWAAGLFEGEGCFTTGTWKQEIKLKGQSYRKSSIRAKISMTDKDVLDTFASIIGFGKVKGPYTHPNPNTKPLYEWSVSGKIAKKLFDVLNPYMHGRRCKQILDTIKRCEDYNNQVNERRKLHKFGPGASK
jgi:hypothetical protein